MTDTDTETTDTDAETTDTGAGGSGDLVAAGGQAIEPSGADVPVPAEAHAHPEPRQYVMIAVVLTIATAIEVGMYYLEGDVADNLLIALLTVLAVVKFVLVAAWYMHMKVDAPFFRRLFTVGMLGAVVVYGVAMLTFASTLLAQ